MDQQGRVREVLFTTSLFILHLALLTYSVIFLPVSWDEGWNFCVARTWIEHSHYGCLLEGQLTTPRLSTGWLSVAPAALGFKLFGLHHISARVLIALQSLGALLALFALTSKVFTPKTGAATILILLLISGDQRVHPMLLGSQGWGEMPMALYIVLGYLFLAGSLPLAAKATLASFFFGLAITCKQQPTPFLLLALAIPAAGIFSCRHRKIASLFLATLLGTYLWKGALFYVPLPYQASEVSAGSGTHGLHRVIGIVMSVEARKTVVEFVLTRFWPLLIGFVHFVWWRGRGFTQGWPSATHAVRDSLFILSATWLSWFVSLSVPFPRYVAPALFFGSPFIGHWLAETTGNFNLRATRAQILTLLRTKGRFLSKATVLCTLALAVLQGLISTRDVVDFFYESGADNAHLYEVAQYLNSKTPQHSLVETYDSQLFFLLQRPYHYPPDQLNVDSIARMYQPDLSSGLKYEPLSANPDYIVEGLWSRHVFEVYKELLAERPLPAVLSRGDFKVFRVDRSK